MMPTDRTRLDGALTCVIWALSGIFAIAVLRAGAHLLGWWE